MTAWIETLRLKCDQSSQRIVAAELQQPDGFPSPALINQVLRGKYSRAQGLDRLQGLVEGRYMAGSPQPPGLVEDGDWINALRVECERRSQSKVAAALRLQDGFPSPTVINQVLLDKYPSDQGRERLQMLVEGRYMGMAIECPVMGEIGRDECAEWQSLPFCSVNSTRVEMFRACLRCPNNRSKDHE